MGTYVVRVWLPDRPGALGHVATRIGAAGGDVVGIEIMDQDSGIAIDELVVKLPEDLVDLLVHEINEAEGASVEDVRPAIGMAVGADHDPCLAALESARGLMAAGSRGALLRTLVDQVQVDLGAQWTAVVDDAGEAGAAAGPVPPAPWLLAFMEGSRASAMVVAGETGPDDLAWTALHPGGLNLVVGRSGRPLRTKERRRLAALAGIAGSRWAELAARERSLG